jgi:ribosomal protein S12 methylthiotransferase
MRSKPLDEIVAEARGLLADGAFELNLIGQDTTSFGMDIGDAGGLEGMLESLDAAVRDHGDGWLRLMYAYPSTFTDSMIDCLGRLEKVVKYLDIPLQHASDRMLKLMRRNVTAGQQRELLEKLRERIPGMAIRTTFITGFPGETDADHEALVELVREFGFDMMGVFKYSREDGTPAGTMDEDPELHVPDSCSPSRRSPSATPSTSPSGSASSTCSSTARRRAARSGGRRRACRRAVRSTWAVRTSRPRRSIR